MAQDILPVPTMKRLSIALSSAIFLAGCGAWREFPIERTVGGSTRLGVFVAPYSYEHFVRGELAREAGELERAADHYELARAGAADDPMLLARIADVRDLLGDRAMAERALAEGERLDSSSEAIWTTRGLIAERHGDHESAIESYARAAGVSEGNEEPVIALSRLLREHGDNERANAVLERYLAEHRGGVGAARALLSLALARNDLRTAGLVALELARRSPQHAREVVRAAGDLLEAGRPTLAHRLLALLPEGTVPRSLLLRAALAAGARSEAESLLLSHTPETLDETLSVAEAWLTLGDPEQAAEVAELAIARGAGTEARLILARACLQANRMSEAAEIAASIPVGTAAHDEAHRLVAEALSRAGLSALADETRGSSF